MSSAKCFEDVRMALMCQWLGKYVVRNSNGLINDLRNDNGINLMAQSL